MSAIFLGSTASPPIKGTSPNRVGVGAGARFRTESVQVEADQFLAAHRLGIRQRQQAGLFPLHFVE
jgi:hypothetical protein